MRFAMLLLGLLVLSGCTGLVLGSSPGGYQTGGDQRDPSAANADSAITVRIREQFAQDAAVSGSNIGIRTYAATVTLTGTVDNFVVRDRAGKIARETSGVAAVNNQVLVAD